MKKINKIFLSLVASGMIVFSGCNHDEFLTEVNPNAITEDTFWQTESDANAALTAAYGALQFQYVSGGGLTYEMSKSDMGGTNSWTRHFAYTEFSISNNEIPVFNKWTELYNGIFRANQVIDNVPNMEELTEDQRKEIVAQAKFLRAFFYFELAHSFGQAVIKTTSITAEHHKPLSSIQEINTQVIIPDLTEAIQYLPKTRPEAELGKVTWGAAVALLGKVYLYDEQWTAAAEQFKLVIDSDLYSLAPNFLDNFRHDVAYNSESIFEVPFDGSINAGTATSHYVDDSPNQSGGESASLARWYGPYSLGGWQVVMPTYWIHELMTADSVAGSDEHSVRYTGTLAGRDAEGMYYNKDASTLKKAVPRRWTFGESSYVKKYANWYHLDQEDPEWRSSINYKHIRYSDVLLMYAEAVLEANSDVATAIEYIDMVRERAGVVLLQEYIDEDGTFPMLHVSSDLYGARPEVEATAENVRNHLRMVERPTELAFENSRWRDLVRWGTVKSTFKVHYEDELERQSKVTAEKDGGAQYLLTAPLFIEQRVRPDFVNNYNFYDSEAHDYFPIPAAEIQANESL